ncbi:permease [Kordiimonas sp. SCSIO 12603]|uniref:permease n=1 Tax=Kordiimonas sp. SCSIO 12603 TaxID=2829596 RepID=UPI002104ECF7|nr:permease [Kordiimonas sp. SCSIO 12603]UTW59089.1 permease [Kordiimonas sp. SCSIO 12603]
MSQQMYDVLDMFLFLAVELSVLFLGISMLVGVLQRHIPSERIESLLSGHSRYGYFIAAGLGAITPFCSCSTIPMLKGLIRAKAGFGPMMVFLFASPLLNPVIVVLLAATFGASLTLTYVLAALLVSLFAGWLLEALNFSRFIRPVEAEEKMACGATNCGDAVKTKGKYAGVWKDAWKDFVGVLPYLLTGIAIGSVIYGYMPTELVSKYASADNPLAIPVAAVIGVPLYIRAEAVIPLAGALLSKGVGAGTILSLIIGSAGASLTELILLRSLFTSKLLIAFVTVIFSMAIIAGYAAFLFF